MTATANAGYAVAPKHNPRWLRTLETLLPHSEALWNRVLMVGERESRLPDLRNPNRTGRRATDRILQEDEIDVEDFIVLPTPTYTVAGLLPGDGASTTAAAIAHYLHKSIDLRVLVVEADLRSPSAYQGNLVPADAPGLVGVLDRKITPRKAIFSWPDAGFCVLPSGGTSLSPSMLLNAARLDSLLGALEPFFEVIILDGPPLSTAPESRHLVMAADATIPVLRSGKALPEQAAQWLGRITEYGGRIGAVCMNAVSSPLPPKLARLF